MPRTVVAVMGMLLGTSAQRALHERAARLGVRMRRDVRAEAVFGASTELGRTPPSNTQACELAALHIPNHHRPGVQILTPAPAPGLHSWFACRYKRCPCASRSR
jgi:hypothetical protein